MASPFKLAQCASSWPFHARCVKYIVAVVGVSIAGLGATGALAYFLAHGTGTTTTTVTTGAAANVPLTFTAVGASGPVLTPGGASDSFRVNANNGNSAAATFGLAVTAKHDASGGVFNTASSSYVDGCQASWFVITLTTGGPYVVPANSAVNVDTVTISLTETGTDQSACESLTPEIDIAAV